MEAITFLKSLGITTLFVALMSGLGYWIYVGSSKKYPNLKYQIKYKVFRRKYNEEDVASLITDVDNGVSSDDLMKVIILTNRASPDKAKELLYIFSELKKIKLKGGLKNE